MLSEYLQNDKKIKTLTDTGELVEDAVHAATVEQNSGELWLVESRPQYWPLIGPDTLNCILKWSQSNKNRKFINKGRSFSGIRGLKINSSAIVFAAKRNDYERVKAGALSSLTFDKN